MRIISLTAAYILLSATVYAQAWPQLVSDIFPGTSSSNPRAFYELGNKLLFQASPSSAVAVLMVSDGTTSGTRALTTNIGPMKAQTTMNGLVYFINDDDDLLWVTDGLTSGGTRSINNITMHNNIFKYQNNLIFGGNRPGENTFLWIGDGTISGTHKVKEISNSSYVDISCFTEINGKVCFYVESGSGNSLWITDGTEAGTKKLKDIWVNNSWVAYSDNSIQEQPDPFKLFNDKLYFAGNDNVHGFELWETDGTEVGTKMTADINPGSVSSTPFDFTVYKDKLVFNIYNPAGVDMDKFDIWTLHGENILTKITNSPLCIFLAYTPFNDKLYTSACGYLYETDGTTLGSRKVSSSIIIHYTVVHDGYLYFEGRDLADPLQINHLYKLDSSNNIIDLFSLNRDNNNNNYRLRSVGGELYFAAAHPDSAMNEDIELYRLDEFPTGVKAVEKMSDKIVYPNPANTAFNVKATTGNATTVNVYSLIGQLLLTTHQMKDISIVHLPAGTYMVQIDSDGKRSTEKLVKQ